MIPKYIPFSTLQQIFKNMLSLILKLLFLFKYLELVKFLNDLLKNLAEKFEALFPSNISMTLPLKNLAHRQRWIGRYTKEKDLISRLETVVVGVRNELRVRKNDVSS